MSYLTRVYQKIEAKENLVAWVLILPAALIMVAVVGYPIVSNIWLSLHDVSLMNPFERPFVGLANYLDFFADPTFWASVGRTAYFTVVSVSLELILGIAIAMLINMKLKGWKFLRAVIIIPWAVPTVVNGIMWKWIYNADYGALNGLLQSLGLIDKYQAWLADPWTAMNLVILADIWHVTPLVVLIISAALAALPDSLYEAAVIDGATSWQSFWRITLPLLRPAILVTLVLRTVEAFRVFDIIYVITGGGPANGTQVISYLAYLESFSYLNLGRGAALSFIVSAFILVLAIVYYKVLYTEDVA
ncbi:MAG: sugar ABC transporter permease [Firmicutes bacterium]|nr:sugar ABC transporter permease [Bacillota bacterium]